MTRPGTYHVLEPGQSLESIAYATGHYWPAVWEHPENASLRELRKDPHVLAVGDRVFLPPLGPKEVPVRTGKRHVFRRRGVPSRIRLVVHTEGAVGAGVPYAIEIDGVLDVGTTGEDGLIEHWIVPDAERVRVRVGLGFEQRLFDVDVRHLQPVSTTVGVQARLHNLGFLVQPDGELGPATRIALRRFQEAHALPVTGEPDDATRAKLEELHAQ